MHPFYYRYEKCINFPNLFEDIFIQHISHKLSIKETFLGISDKFKVHLLRYIFVWTGTHSLSPIGSYSMYVWNTNAHKTILNQCGVNNKKRNSILSSADTKDQHFFR